MRSYAFWANARELVHAGSVGGVIDLVYDSYYERLFQERYDEQRRVHNLAYENKRR